jgi:hypothetical protein
VTPLLLLSRFVVAAVWFVVRTSLRGCALGSREVLVPVGWKIAGQIGNLPHVVQRRFGNQSYPAYAVCRRPNCVRRTSSAVRRQTAQRRVPEIVRVALPGDRAVGLRLAVDAIIQGCLFAPNGRGRMVAMRLSAEVATFFRCHSEYSRNSTECTS